MYIYLNRYLKVDVLILPERDFIPEQKPWINSLLFFEVASLWYYKYDVIIGLAYTFYDMYLIYDNL